MNRNGQLCITWEWESAPPVRAAELRETWARVEIRVGDDTVTLVEDRETGSSRRSIYCSLYPLAEWIAYNWWFLKVDARPASRLGFAKAPWLGKYQHIGRRQVERHQLRSAGDGFQWPNLLIIPEGAQTRLVWRRDHAANDRHPTKFISQGEALVDSSSLEETLSSVVATVLARLDERGVTNTPLAEEWQAIKGADGEEVDFCLAAARLGLDPYSDALKFESEMISAAEQLDGQLYIDFLNAVDPALIRQGLNWITEASGRLEIKAAPKASDVHTLREQVRSADTRNLVVPWQTGWHQAEAVRHALGLDATEPFDPSNFLTSIDYAVADRGLHAFGKTSTESGATVALGRPLSPTSRRFMLSRALWHVVCQDESDFLVTSAYTDRQKVERAFAAELLAPARGVAEELDDIGMITEEDVEQVAEHFGVSTMVIEHQLENQILADLI